MANKLLRRRIVALVALVVLSVILGKCGHPNPGHGFGLWEGPL